MISTRLATAILFSTLASSLLDAKPPSSVANLFTLLELKLQQPTPGFRIQIMRVSQDVFIDPPPRAENFESVATYVVTVDPTKVKDGLFQAARQVRESTWEKQEHPGYPRWRLRFVGPWHETFGELCIDDENCEILVGDTWHKVDANLVRTLTHMLVKAAVAEPSPSQ